MKRLLMCALAVTFSASMAFAAGQTEVSNVDQSMEMEGRASIKGNPNSAGGGIKWNNIGASGGASYAGSVEANTIDASGGSKVRNVRQKIKMKDNTTIEGSSVKVNTIRAAE